MDIRKIDRVFSEYTRRKNADELGYVKCVTCGKVLHWKEMQCGHFISRRHFSTRWMEANAHPQCEECNCHKQGNIKAYELYMCATFGHEMIKCLEDLSHRITKYTQREIYALAREYEKKIREISQV